MHRSTWQGRVYWVQTSFSTQTNSYMDHNTTEVCKYKQDMNGHVKDQISIDLTVLKNIYFKIFDRLILNIQYKKFQSRWYQIDTCLPFSLNLRHGLGLNWIYWPSRSSKLTYPLYHYRNPWYQCRNTEEQYLSYWLHSIQLENIVIQHFPELFRDIVRT